MDLAKLIPIIRPGSDWSLSGNDLSGLTWRGPGEPPTQAECEAAWATLQSEEAARKTWPDAEAFMEEFTFEEKSAIGLSVHPYVAALRMTLTTWNGRVLSDDERVQQGLGLLLALQIINQDRLDEIVAK
jgi:hypothetical protein